MKIYRADTTKEGRRRMRARERGIEKDRGVQREGHRDTERYDRKGGVVRKIERQTHRQTGMKKRGRQSDRE